jgi:hypothetical protein
MPLYYRDDLMLSSDHESDKQFAKHYKLNTMNFNSSNYSAEENLCNEMISACECLLDDFNWGEHLNSDELEMLKLAHANIWEVYGQVNERSRPSNIKDFNDS